jgi:hypothetical protein
MLIIDALHALDVLAAGGAAAEAAPTGAEAAAEGGRVWITGAMLAAGVAVLTVVSLRVWHRRRRRSASGERQASARERLDTLARASERDTLESLMVEVQELTRTCAAQLDNRARQMNELVQQADERIGELQATLRAEPARREPTPTTMPFQPAAARRLALDDEPTDPIAERIFELSRAGLSPIDIARKLDEQVGKVELVLAMEAKRSA